MSQNYLDVHPSTDKTHIVIQMGMTCTYLTANQAKEVANDIHKQAHQLLSVDRRNALIRELAETIRHHDTFAKSDLDYINESVTKVLSMLEAK